MKKILFITLSVYYLACAPAQHTSTYRKQMKESYIYSFKMTYFKKILLAGFNNSDAIKEVMEVDHSGYGELILSMQDLVFIDSMVHVDNIKMVSDSTASIGRVAEGAQGKRIFDYALLRYESKSLDSIAKIKSKPFMKTLE